MAQFVDETITAEIVAAKNKLVLQANRAEEILDTWTEPTSGIGEAPIDGKQYARKDADWSEVTTVDAGVMSVVAGDNITIDNTDPSNPIISSTATGGGGGGTGDMLASVYDPTGKAANAFSRSNMTGSQSIDTITGLETELTTLSNSIDTKLDDDTIVEIVQNSDQDNYFFKLSGQTSALQSLPSATTTKSGVMSRQQVSDLESLVTGGGVSEVVGGDLVTVNNTDAKKPVIDVSVGFGDLTGLTSDNAQLNAALNNKQPQASVLTNTTASFTTELKTKVDASIADAPIDGIQYTRKDGEWSELESSGGGGGIILSEGYNLPVMTVVQNRVWDPVTQTQLIVTPSIGGTGDDVVAGLISAGAYPSGTTFNNMPLQKIEWYYRNVQPTFAGDAFSFPEDAVGQSAHTQLFLSRTNGDIDRVHYVCLILSGTFAGKTYFKEGRATTTGTWISL